MSETITLTREMTKEEAEQAFNQHILGTDPRDLPKLVSNEFELVYLPDGTAVLHIALNPVKFGDVVQVKFVVQITYEEGVAVEVKDVQRGLIGP